MKIEEYLETLPKNLLSGEDVQLPEKTLKEIFKFSNLGKDDIFFHLGCNNEKGVDIAINEFKVKKVIGKRKIAPKNACHALMVNFSKLQLIVLK